MSRQNFKELQHYGSKMRSRAAP